jgi:large conductance mechanosensitive channel
MGFFQEFKEFALKGSVVDLAVGLVIGTAFGAIVKSLVDDIIMPLLGFILKGTDLGKRYVVLRGRGPSGTNETVAQAREAGNVIVTYGNFLNTVLTFLLISFALFIVIKQINRLRRLKKHQADDPTEKNCPYCLQPIPIKATRCFQCTSELPPPSAAEAASESRASVADEEHA